MTDPKKERFKVIVDVHLLLKKDDQLLFGLRKNTGYYDDSLHFPAGHMEADESVVDTLIREASEEIGVTIDSAAVRLVHIMHNSSGGGRVAFFFEVTEWTGEPINMEPDKCAELRWVSLAEPPIDMIPYAESALRSYKNREPFSLYDWPEESAS